MVSNHHVFLFLSLIWQYLVLQGVEEMGAKGVLGKRGVGLCFCGGKGGTRHPAASTGMRTELCKAPLSPELEFSRCILS